MKTNFMYAAAIAVIVILSGCGGSRHASAAKASTDTVYIPFTKDLKKRIESSNLDIKKVQFFIDERLVLRRSMGTQKGDIKSGVVLFENGQYVNEVIIPRYTPAVCESVTGDRLMISFELQNNDIEFGPGGANDNYFTLYARNWNAGTADVTYDNKLYKVQCASCFNAGDVRLVVRKSEADKLQRTQRTIEGRRVDN